MESGRPFKYRVLVVDDDPLVLAATAAVVRSFGFSVRTAEDGFAALHFLRQILPDIILTDLRMPGMSGFELLSIVRRRFPHIPTIAISGEYMAPNLPIGLLVDHFFRKGGYTPPQLFAKMKELIAVSPIRPRLGKIDKAPVWIPRGGGLHGYNLPGMPPFLLNSRGDWPRGTRDGVPRMWRYHSLPDRLQRSQTSRAEGETYSQGVTPLELG